MFQLMVVVVCDTMFSPPPPPPHGFYTHIHTTCAFSAVVHEYTRVCVAVATFACSSTVLLHATHTSISTHTKYTLLSTIQATK